MSLADKQIISDLIKGCNYSRSFVEGKDVTGVLHRRRQRWHFKKCSAFFPQTPFLNFWEQDYSLIEVTAEKSQHEERATCGQRLAVEMTMSKTHTYYDMQESLHPYFHYSRSSLWLWRTLDKKKMTSQKIDASDCRHLFYPASIIPKAATLWLQAREFPLRIKKIPNIFFSK